MRARLRKVCTLSGCSNPHEAKGFCATHYSRFSRYGDPQQVFSKRGEDRKKHPLYSVYRNMKTRCYNSASSSYKYYGERGIKVCDRWLGIEGFTNFVKDMGIRPKGTSIDRIDVNGNYEPGNCRWADNCTQSKNRRKPIIQSGFTGVYPRGGKFQARAYFQGKDIYVGTFDTAQEASQARLRVMGES